MRKWIITLLVIAGLLAGCTPVLVVSQPSADLLPTLQISATLTAPASTPTSNETATPDPTQTATPQPSITPALPEAPTPTAVQLTTIGECSAPSGVSAGWIDMQQVGSDMCILWADTYENEMGFRLVLRFENTGEIFVYETPPDVTGIPLPPELTAPLDQSFEFCIDHYVWSLSIHALLPDQEPVPVTGMAFNSECNLFNMPSATPTAELPTSLPNAAGLTIVENEILGQIGLEPLTFQPVRGTQQEVMTRHAAEKQEPREEETDYRAARTESGGEEVKGGALSGLTIQVLRGDQVIFTTSAGLASPINSLRGLWVVEDHWYLEVAYVEHSVQGNEISFYPTGRIFRDGVLLNEQYGYEEMFGFQMLAGKPFYFYRKDGQIHLSYDNQELPLVYDDVRHYLCCSAGVLNPSTGANWVGFFGMRGGVSYYTEIGMY